MTSTARRGATGFRALGVPADLVEALAADDITEPFPIQTACLPDALAGRDLCGRAATGSGKTLAYGIPMMATVEQAEPFHPTGIILVPTRELAKQVRLDLLSMGKARRRYILAVYGGTPYAGQLNSFKLGASVIVACPGRLLDFVRRRQIFLDRVQMCVVDEADRLADLGFMEDVTELLGDMPDRRQMLLFSATLDGDVDGLIKQFQRDPVHVEVDAELAESTPATHQLLHVRPIEKVGAAANLVRQHGRTIVFTKTRENTDSLTDSLRASGIRVAPLHGGMSQGQRERSLESLRSGRIDALVATDVVGRGIHVDDVELVLHWDVPADPKDYVHRSGRTARAGAGGRVITLVTDKTVRIATRIAEQAGVEIEGAAMPPSKRSRQGDARRASQDDVTTISRLAARPRGPRRPARSPRPR